MVVPVLYTKSSVVFKNPDNVLPVSVACLPVNAVFVAVLFESTFLSTASIKASADIPFTAIHAPVANAIEPANAIKPVEGIAGMPKEISPGLPSVPSNDLMRRSNLSA